MANDTSGPITAQELRDLLSYDPSTGNFTWKPRPVRIEFIRTDLANNTRLAGRVAGTTHCRGYRHIKIDGREYKAHRLAWLYIYDRWPRNEIDHINGDPGDNRIRNLREATRWQNMANRQGARTDSLLGVRGVTRVKSRFEARLRVHGKHVQVGTFATVAEAEAAVKAKRQELFGEFAGVLG